MEKSEPPIGCGPITFRVFSLSLPSCACRALCSLGALAGSGHAHFIEALLLAIHKLPF